MQHLTIPDSIQHDVRFSFQYIHDAAKTPITWLKVTKQVVNVWNLKILAEEYHTVAVYCNVSSFKKGRQPVMDSYELHWYEQVGQALRRM